MTLRSRDVLIVAATIGLAAALITARRMRRPSKAVLWLQYSLRVRDNAALTRAIEVGATGLAVVYVWRHAAADACKSLHGNAAHAGRGYTATQAFEAAALASLDKELRLRGGKLVMMRMPGGTRSDAACAVARFAAASDATRVLVEELRMDQGEPPCSKLIAAALRDIGQQLTVVEIASDDNLRLFPRTEAAGVLGRSRAGGGGKVLRWAAFLKAADDLDEPARPIPPASQLPPPLAAPRFDRTAGMPGAEAAAAVELPLSGHALGGADARIMGRRGERDDSAEASHGGGAACGAFDRHRRMGPQHDCRRRGQQRDCTAVAPFTLFALGGDFGARGGAPGRATARPLVARLVASLLVAALSAPSRRAEVPPLDGSCLRAAAHPATPVHMSVVSEREAFEAWCVGRTGAPLVDAGMRQLWVEGWMPRRVRLLCACCLTEGMGIDWRLGRDWFALTLIDHAIPPSTR